MAPPKSDGMLALAAMCTHVPNKGEQMVRYYGFYSPAFRGMARGKRKKKDEDGLIPSILTTDGSTKEHKAIRDKSSRYEIVITRFLGSGFY